MAEPDVARFEAVLTSRGRELLDRIATEAPGPETALRIGASLRGLYPTELVIEALALASAPISWAMLRSWWRVRRAADDRRIKELRRDRSGDERDSHPSGDDVLYVATPSLRDGDGPGLRGTGNLGVRVGRNSQNPGGGGSPCPS
jgi:hypothetical protein